jgi:hypothetical protein
MVKEPHAAGAKFTTKHTKKLGPVIVVLNEKYFE